MTVDVLSGSNGGPDTDPDSDLLTVKSITTLPLHGVAVINGDNTVTYSPNPGYGGPDYFVYQVADGKGGFDTATVTLLVASDSGPIARDDATTTTMNAPVTIDVLDGSAGGTDSDVDGDKLTVLQITSDPSNGSASINPGKRHCQWPLICLLRPFNQPSDPAACFLFSPGRWNN